MAFTFRIVTKSPLNIEFIEKETGGKLIIEEVDNGQFTYIFGTEKPEQLEKFQELFN